MPVKYPESVLSVGGEVVKTVIRVLLLPSVARRCFHSQSHHPRHSAEYTTVSGFEMLVGLVRKSSFSLFQTSTRGKVLKSKLLFGRKFCIQRPIRRSRQSNAIWKSVNIFRDSQRDWFDAISVDKLEILYSMKNLLNFVVVVMKLLQN